MNIRNLIEKYGMTLRDDGNVSLKQKPTNIEEIKKLKSQIIEELKKIEQEEKIAGDPRTGKLRLAYYYGDWYRPNAIFKDNCNMPEWGNNANVFSSIDLNKATSSFWVEAKNSGYADPERIVNHLEKFFSCTLQTTKEEMKNRFPDLVIEMAKYDDMRGTGEYVSDIIFPDFITFEKYVAAAFAADMVEMKQDEKKAAAIFATAKETGKKQLLDSHATECCDPDEECSTDIVSIYAMPDGTSKTERCHTW